MASTLGVATLATAVDLEGLGEGLDEGRGHTESWLSSLGGSVSTLLGGAVVAGAALIVGAVVGIGAAAFTAGMVVDDALDTIVIATGATGDELAALEDNFATVFSSVPTDAGTAASVVGTLNQRLGITGDALNDLAIPLAQVTELIGGDAVTHTELFTRVMGDWGVSVEDGAGTLDTFFAASQATGAGMDDLMAKVVQFGSPLRLMGFSLEESIAMFAKWEQEGVNAELVMGSLRIAAGKFADANIPLRDGLNQTMEAIMGAASESEALAIGMDVFGARAGPDMVAAILEGRFAIEDLLAVMEDSEGAIMDTAAQTADFGEMWTLAKNKITLALAPIGAMMIGLANHIMPLLTNFIEQRLMPAISTFVNILNAFMSGSPGDFPWEDIFPPWLADTIYAIIGGLEALMGGGDFVTEFGILMFNIGAAFGFTEDQLEPLVMKFWEFSGWLTAVGIPALQEFGSAAMTWITGTLVPALVTFGSWVSENRETILQVLGGIVAGLAAFSIITTVVGWITGLIAAVSAVGAGITAAGGIIAAIIAILGGPLTIIIGAVAIVIGLLAAAWAGNWGDIQGKTHAAVDFIQNLISTALAAIQGWWAAHGAQVVATVQGFMAAVQSGIQTAINFIQGVVTTVLNSIRTFWQQHGDAIMAVVNIAFTFIRNTIDNALQFVTGIWQAFQSAREGDWTAFGEHLRTAWDALWNQVQNVLTAAQTAMGTIVSEIVTTVLGWWDSLKTNSEGKFNELVASIVGIITGTDWGALGSDLLQGIANGITAASGFIVAAIQNALTAALEAAMGFMDSGSPARNPAIVGLGSSFVQGIGVGMQEEQATLARSTEQSLEKLLDILAHAGEGRVGHHKDGTPANSFTNYGGISLYGVQDEKGLLEALQGY